MDSKFGALQYIVLPTGATSGQRIILDGVNGRIDIYDASNNLVARIDATSIIKVFSANGAQAFLWSGAPNAAIGIRPPPVVGHTLDDAALYTQDGSGTVHDQQLLIVSPQIDSRQKAFHRLISEGLTGLIPVSEFFAYTGGAGFTQSDITWDGRGLGRGVLDFVTSSTAITLSTVAGTYTTLITSNGVELFPNRRYRVTYSGGSDINVAGSGHTVTDEWKMRFQVDTGGGFGALPLTGPQKLFRLQVAAVTRQGVGTWVGHYESTVDAVTFFRAQATKASGAGTVTSAITTSDGPMALTVEDIGRWA